MSDIKSKMNDAKWKMIHRVDGWINSAKGGAMLNVGDKAPEFEVLSHEGKTVNLKDYLGKTIILFFYPRADTPG